MTGARRAKSFPRRTEFIPPKPVGPNVDLQSRKENEPEERKCTATD